MPTSSRLPSFPTPTSFLKCSTSSLRTLPSSSSAKNVPPVWRMPPSFFPRRASKIPIKAIDIQKRRQRRRGMDSRPTIASTRRRPVSKREYEDAGGEGEAARKNPGSLLPALLAGPFDAPPPFPSTRINDHPILFGGTDCTFAAHHNVVTNSVDPVACWCGSSGSRNGKFAAGLCISGSLLSSSRIKRGSLFL